MTKNKALTASQGKEKFNKTSLPQRDGVGESQPQAQRQGGVNNA